MIVWANITSKIIFLLVEKSGIKIYLSNIGVRGRYLNNKKDEINISKSRK